MQLPLLHWAGSMLPSCTFLENQARSQMSMQSVSGVAYCVLWLKRLMQETPNCVGS